MPRSTPGTGRAGVRLPADGDGALKPRQRQGARFRLDSVALRPGEPAPRLDRHRVVRPPPRPADLAVDEDGAGPHPRGPERRRDGRRPERAARGRLPEQEVGVAARQEPRRRGRPGTGADDRLVAREERGVAERRSDGGQRPLERCECRRARLAAMSRPSGQTPRAWRGRRREGARASSRRASAGRRRAAGRSRSSAAAPPPTGSRPCPSSRRIGASWRAPRSRCPASP